MAGFSEVFASRHRELEVLAATAEPGRSLEELFAAAKPGGLSTEDAAALLAWGRAREAIYPLHAALRGDLLSSNLYVTRTGLHELLAEAFAAVGARDSASVHYRLVARAWAHAEAPFAHRRVHAAAFLTRS